jgi:hypothetical protein
MKRFLRCLMISICALAFCGVFYFYIIESIGAIKSERAAHQNSSAQAHSPSTARSGGLHTAVTRPPGRPAPAQSKASSAQPSASAPSIASQWRIIERSDSFDGQLQYYSPGNVALDEGRIVITTREEIMGDKRYTSGMVESESAFLYGRFSFVISVSEGKGLFPAIWLLPVENKALPEIDIYEMIGRAPDVFYGVVHYMDGPVQKRDYFKTKVEKKDTYLIELEWTRECLRWFIDGKCMLESSKYVPSEPMYLIVNQALGGTWPGLPDKTTVFPATFTIESWTIEPEWSQLR